MCVCVWVRERFVRNCSDRVKVTILYVNMFECWLQLIHLSVSVVLVVVGVGL